MDVLKFFFTSEQKPQKFVILYGPKLRKILTNFKKIWLFGISIKSSICLL